MLVVVVASYIQFWYISRCSTLEEVGRRKTVTGHGIVSPQVNTEHAMHVVQNSQNVFLPCIANPDKLKNECQNSNIISYEFSCCSFITIINQIIIGEYETIEETMSQGMSLHGR